MPTAPPVGIGRSRRTWGRYRRRHGFDLEGDVAHGQGGGADDGLGGGSAAAGGLHGSADGAELREVEVHPVGPELDDAAAVEAVGGQG